MQFNNPTSNKNMARPNRGAAHSAVTSSSIFSSCTLSLTTWLLLSLLAATHCCQQSTALPTGFVSEVVSQVKATTGRFVNHPSTGTPMLLVVNKNGEVHAVLDVERGTDNGRKILDLSGNNDVMCTNGERGLQSIEVHPQFSENRWVYLYYNKFQPDCLEDVTKGPYNVVARYTMNAETLELENEEILMEGARLGERVHNGGAMLFSKEDNKLYVTTGDAGVRENAQNLKNLHGSLLRLNDDGSVPSDNPFVEDGTGVSCGQSEGRLPDNAPEGAVCSEIWAWGFRNPFRMSPDISATGKIIISDVGAQHWEELSWGGSGFKAANYGWPVYEGPCKAGTTDACEAPPEGSNHVQPFHFYQHKSKENGGCVSGSVLVPEFVWPEEYKFLFIDFIFLKIYNLVEDGSAECLSCTPPTSGYRNETFYESIQEDEDNVNEARMVDMFFGPYEDTLALYIIKFGNNDSILRVRYTDSVNAPPLPKIVIQNPSDKQTDDKDLIVVGNVVQFDGSQSSDPDGETLTFEWSFGDGNTSTNKSPSHVYNNAGEYLVTLIVTDVDDQAQQTHVTVVVGQPPTASIVSPAEGADFDVGQVLKLQGLAFDSDGQVIPDDQIMWEVRQHHADHYHPFMDETTGNSLDLFPAPEPEDFFAATNSFLEVIMRATDSNGVTTEISRDVQPRKVKVDIQTEPEGLEVMVDDYVVVAPQEIVSWVNFELPLRVEDQLPFVFQGWENGKTSKSRNTTLPFTEEKLFVIARFCLERNSFCGTSSICCSGVCNTKGVCEGPPQTRPPFSTGIEEDDLVGGPVEDNVDDSFGDVPILPGVEDPVVDDTIEYQSTNSNLQDKKQRKGLSNSEKWLLSLLMIVVTMFPFFVGLIYCRRGRKNRDGGAKRSLSETDDCSDEEQTPIASSFTTPAKDSLSAIGHSLSESASYFTSSIWEKLAEENERRAKIRAKLDAGNFVTEAPGVAATPETVAASPASTKSPSSVLSSSIDETLVRLDDILSRTFQFSRSRRSELSTPEKRNIDAVADSAIVASPESDLEDIYLDTSSQLLLPLGDANVPHSPLREDRQKSFVPDAADGFSFVSNALEDGLNDSAVHISDNHSVHSASGRWLCHDPTVPKALLNDADDESAADPDFFPATPVGSDLEGHLLSATECDDEVAASQDNSVLTEELHYKHEDLSLDEGADPQDNNVLTEELHSKQGDLSFDEGADPQKNSEVTEEAPFEQDDSLVDEVADPQENCDTTEEAHAEKEDPSSQQPSRDEGEMAPADITGAGESTLEPPSFFDASSEVVDEDDDLLSHGCSTDDSSSSDYNESTPVEQSAFYSADSVSSGHSLV